MGITLLKSHRKIRRRGVTTVEVAFALPILLLLFFGHLEFSRAHMLWHTVHTAAYEGARRGIVPGASVQDIRDTAVDIMDCIGAINPTVTVTPSVLDVSTQEVTVSVSIAMNENIWVVPRFFRDKIATGTITLQREEIDYYSSL